MSSKRKAPSAVKQDAKRVRSTGSRTRSVNQQKYQDERGITFASSSAQNEGINNRTSSNIDKELDDYQRNTERRIILIGKTGAGKSSLGNAMLGYKRFETDGFQMQSITKHCQIGQKKRNNGKNIVVIDTPGLKDTQQKDRKIIEELCKCSALTAPGPHAFCLVIDGSGRFTKESIETLDEFCKFFGEEIYKYLIVVFTHQASMGRSTTTDDCLSVLPTEFLAKFLKFGGKKIAIESNAKEKALEKQINELFKLIEEIIERNEGGYYSEEKLKAAEDAFRKHIHKIQQDVEKVIEKKKKSLEDEYQEKAKRFKEQENIYNKKLQEEKDKLMQEQQLKEKEKLEKDACVAHMKMSEAKHQEEIKSLEEKLEKERREREKTKEDFDREMEKINNKIKQEFQASFDEYRSKVKEAIAESKRFFDVERNAENGIVGLAYDVITSPLRTAITGRIGRAIGAIGRYFRR